MSRDTYAPKEVYVGANNLAIYTFDFKIEALAQLLVIEVDDNGVETQRVLGTDSVYLSGVVFDAVEGAGTVTLAANLPTDFNLILLLANDLPTQTFKFRNKTSFTLKRFESALDLIAGAVQRLAYRGKQAFRIHDLDDEDTFNSQLPPGVATSQDRVLIVNSAGDGMAYGPTAAVIASAESEANDAAASAAAASTSESNAATSESNAATSESNAATSETNAATSETNAATSATNAATSETNAATSATDAAAAKSTFENAPTQTKTDNFILTDADVGKLTIMNAISAKTFTLYDITADDDVIFLKNIGATDVTVAPHASDTSDITNLEVGETVILIADDSTNNWELLSIKDRLTDGLIRGNNGIGISIDPGEGLTIEKPTFFAGYEGSSVDATYGDGDLTGTPTGAPPVTGGELDLSGGTLKYVDYDPVSNVSLNEQEGTVRLKWTPDYSGSPADNQSLFIISNSANNANSLSLIHLTSGQVRIQIYDKDAVVQLNEDLGSFTAVSGTEVEWEVNYDLDPTGTDSVVRVFIDGIQKGSTQTGFTIDRDATLSFFRIGSNRTATKLADFKLDYVTAFNTVQHEANYTVDPVAPTQAGKLLLDEKLPDLTAGTSDALKRIRVDSTGRAYEIVLLSDVPANVANKQGALIAQNAADTGYDLLTSQGTTNQVLTSQGPDATPTFEDATAAGGINYIDNNDAEVDTADWSTYDDGAVSEPVDGTGGASSTLTFTRNTSSPLRGNADFDLAKSAADGQGEGNAVPFTIDIADKDKILSVTFDYAVGGSFATGDVGMFIYDVTNANIIKIDPDEDLNVGGGKFQGTFLATSSTSYRLIFHVRTTNASAWTLNFDNVIVGPQVVIFGPAMTDFEDRTSEFTINGVGTPTEVKIVVKRVGDEAIIRGTFKPGTTSGDTASLTLPLDMQVDVGDGKTATSAGNSQTHLAGTFYRQNGSSRFWTNGIGGPAFIDTDDGSAIFFNDDSNSTTEFIKVTGALLWSTGQAVHFELRVPIAGWSTNVVTSESRTFRISNFVANGTRVTATPTKLGEYRTLIKDNAAQTQSDNALSQTDANIAADGMKIFSTSGTGAGTSGEPNRWVIFVGKRKHVKFRYFSSVGKTGVINTDFVHVSASTEIGLFNHYDPTTGLATINCPIVQSNTTRNVGNSYSSDTAGNALPTDCFFEVIVSDNALSVQSEPTIKIAIITDEKSAGTHGGDATSGAWRQRVLNTLVDPYNIVQSLADDIFTLPAGRYLIKGISQFSAPVNNTRTKLVSDPEGTPVDEVFSLSGNVAAGNNTRSPFTKLIDIISDTEYDLQYRVQTTKTVNGLGNNAVLASSPAAEAYAEIVITKLN